VTDNVIGATSEQVQVAQRCRKLATQVDELVLALRQKGAPLTARDDAIGQLQAMAPLEQALIRYRLKMLESLEIPFLSVDTLTTSPVRSG